MRPLALMIAISVLIGIAAPKASPIWPDPVPYIKTAANKGGVDGNRGVARVGYGTDDSRLGGPFIGDDSIVFQAEASEKNYWKVETKDSYTGKGWVSSGSTPLQFRDQDLVPVFSIPESVETEEETAKLLLFIDYNHLMYPAGIKRFKFNQNYNLEIDTNKEKITVLDFNQVDVAPDSYSVEYAVPKYNASDLRITTDPSQAGPEFIKKYTQLPENLPDRVKQLAEEITAGKSNWFDKAKAVESYFGSSEYTYDQTNVAIPGEDDDYVDQFLFDTKIGYCDNFSTSMAVMLRTLGIPTRWVKGYTGGEFIGYSKLNPSEQIYEITNNNAHSWVEVYFPNQGWVPFEPTKGFFNNVSINYLTDGETPSSSEAAPPPVSRPVQEQLEESTSTSGADDSANLGNLWPNIKNFFVNNWKKMVFLIIAGGGIVGILYRIRGKWVPYLYLLRFKLKKNEESIGEAYLILLNQLDRYGLKRMENQTLRNYASYIDNFFSTKEMTRLTDRYEQFLYHQQLPEESWKDSRKLWENLIKKTIA
jgi:transglutaminase-like putative cysteine protease